jgi:hypothetical protein
MAGTQTASLSGPWTGYFRAIAWSALMNAYPGFDSWEVVR